jgi:spermidine/putrescine transport system permease protein
MAIVMLSNDCLASHLPTRCFIPVLPMPPRPARHRSFSWLAPFALLMFGFMYLPILVLAFYSFNQSPYSAGWTGFTLEWYRQFFADTKILAALKDSLTVAILAVGIAAVIGTLMAVGLARYRFPGKRLYRGISYLPIIIPDIAIAVATLVFLAAVAIPLSGGLVQLSLGTIVAAHVVFCLSYIALVVSTRLTTLNPHLEEAAMDLGATPTQALLQVLLPELMPAIVSGCLLAFVLSMDDFLIASFTAGGGASTLPMEIFSRIRTGIKPDINALSVVLILASGFVFFVAEYVRSRSEQKRLK